MKNSAIFRECISRYSRFGEILTHTTSELLMNYRADVAIACLEAVDGRKKRMKHVLYRWLIDGSSSPPPPPSEAGNRADKFWNLVGELEIICGEALREKKLWPWYRYRRHSSRFPKNELSVGSTSDLAKVEIMAVNGRFGCGNGRHTVGKVDQE